MSSPSILFADRPGEWRDVHGKFRSITITASYSATEKELTGPPPRSESTYSWNSSKAFLIRPSSNWYSTAMRDSCCACNWYAITGIFEMDKKINITPTPDPDDEEDSVYYSTQLYKKADLLQQPGFETLEGQLTAENYLVLDCRFAGAFMALVGNYYQEMINPADPTGPSILRLWTNKTVTADGAVLRKWTRENGSWVSDCGIIAAFPADRRSELGCVKPTALSGSWTINANDLAAEYNLTGTFTLSIVFGWAS